MTGWALVVAALGAGAAALALPPVPARQLRRAGPPGRLGRQPLLDWLGRLDLSGWLDRPPWPARLAPLARRAARPPAITGIRKRRPDAGSARALPVDTPVRRRDSLAVGLELIAVGLQAGQPPDAALASVASAVPGPLGQGLASAASALRLGLPAERAWAALSTGQADRAAARGAGPDDLSEIGRLLARVIDGGVPAARLLTTKAAALRAAAQAEALTAARRVGVLAIFPLVVCLLPAFGLLCIVPAVLTALPGSGA